MADIQDLRDELNKFITRRDSERENFLNRFNTNPSNAIANYSAGLASIEETARLAQCIIEIADSENNEMDLVDSANYVLEVQTKTLVRHSQYPPSSSSQFSNLVEIYKVHGIANLKDELLGLGGVLEYINNQREREQQGEENEALFEVFKSTKKSLLRRMRSYISDANNSKTQKEELANARAAEALEAELNILKNRAASYGLGEKLEEVTVNSY